MADKKRLIISIIMVLILVVGIIGVSYALAKMTLVGKKNILMTVQNVTLSLTEDSSNTISIHGGLPMSEAEGKAQTIGYKFVLDNTGNSSVTYDLYLENDSEAQTACGDCSLIDNNYISYELKKEGSVVKTGVTEPSHPIIQDITIKAGKQQIYELRVWLNLSADNSAMNKYYFGRIKLDATQASAGSLVEQLLEEYTNKNEVGTYNNWDKTKMYTFHSTAGDQQAGYTSEELTEYRYIGSIPDNYITFNDELWRIIGIFTVEDKKGNKERRIKIMRNESLGDYAFDNTTVESDWGKNRWSDARLMKVLNPGYENDSDPGGSSYWNKKSETCYLGFDSNASVTCDFSTIGLNNTSKKSIAETKWYLGGETSFINTPYFYRNERGTQTYYSATYPRETSWIGYIGLVYPTDYGYTYGLGVAESCFTNLNSCSGIPGPSSGWMFDYKYQWTLTPYTAYSHSVYIMNGTGNADYKRTSYSYGIRPTVYLKANVKYCGGTGTISDPFQIS